MKAGSFDSFSFLFENGDLRKISVLGQELIQRIYYAVRDEAWLNVPYTLKNKKSIQTKTNTVLSYDLHFLNDSVDYLAHINISIDKKTITVEATGKANSDFKKNRIGLCVHLPASLKGKEISITYSNSQQSSSVLPFFVSPHQPFKDISELEIKSENCAFKLSFEGDVFEMEDQRNWTDASYKIYSTPLELPFPVKVEKNEVFYQKITLSLSDISQLKPGTEKTVSLESVPCPVFGLYQSVLPNKLKDDNRLFSFVRVDFRLFEELWESDVLAIINRNSKIRLPYYCVLYFSDNFESELQSFLNFVEKENLKERIHSIALLSSMDFLLADTSLKKILAVVRTYFPKARIGVGTDANFAQLNRNRPDTKGIDFLCYSIQPQEHASDMLSLVENILGQYDTVATSKTFADKKEIDIIALSIYRRFNANTDFIVKKEQSFDYEYKGSGFEAAWFIGSMHQLVTAGVQTITIAADIDANPLLIELLNYMSDFYPDFFYSEGSLFPEKYSFISWKSKNKRHLIFANLTSEELNLLHYDFEINLLPFEIKKTQVELS